MRRFAILLAGLAFLLPMTSASAAPPETSGALADLVAKHGEGQRARIERGLRQVAALWRPEDGDSAAFREFAKAHFLADEAEIDEAYGRFLFALESVVGHGHMVSRDVQRQVQLDFGVIRPYDEIMAAWNPLAHVADDWFGNKLAFVILLNFPQTTLAEKLKDGPGWSRRKWGEARLAESFSRRVPAEVQQATSAAYSVADNYIAGWNLYMHHLLTKDGKRLFPKGLRLLTHWNLRDELKGRYADKSPEGILRQRMIAKVMEKIVRQEVPQVVIDDPRYDWNVDTGAVTLAPAETVEVSRRILPELAPPSSARENDERYAQLLSTFRAERKVDPWSPAAPTKIARRFEEDRELPEDRVRKIFEEILGSPMVPRVAKLIEKRLARKLEPHDLWYAGFTGKGKHPEEELDRIVSAKYPTTEAFQKDLPNILRGLGFSAPQIELLAAKITVDPARGSGHADGAEGRMDQSHLRTRIPAGGMNYKGYNIAIHELGHNVEQTFSLYGIDHWTMRGVPNTAFTEALAFVFQARDLELLGLGSSDAAAKDLAAINDFWMTFEIAGVGLVDMDVWRWMYAHPEATPAELRAATIGIARETWNRWYAPFLGGKDTLLLGIYSHMIDAGLYLPDYTLGHLIAFQVELAFEGKNLGAEFERVTRQGRFTPDLWMTGATGMPLSARPLLDATSAALARFENEAKAKGRR